MRFGILAAALVLWTQPLLATEITYTFSGTGEGFAGRVSEYTGIRTAVNNAAGNVTFDPAQAVTYGDGLIYDFEGAETGGALLTIFASVQGDRLYLDVARDGSATTGHDYSAFTLNALFNPGYLNGLFPTSIDPSQLISATFAARWGFCLTRCDNLTAFGLTSQLNAAISGSGRAGAGAFVTTTGVAAVPEPASWLMMLMGFAAIGVAARNRRWSKLKTA